MAKDDLKCSGRPEQLCNLLVDKLSEEDGSSRMLVVGLPLSGKRETAELLGKRLGEKGCRVIKVRADRKCANTLQEIIFQLGEVGVKVDAESINRMLKMDDTEDGRLTIYKHSLKRALENADVPRIVIIVQATENLGEIMEDELIAHPPSSVSWIFISSMPLKVILSQDSCGSTYTNLHFDSGHMFFLPLPANSIASCDKKKEEIVKFLKQIRTFEDCEPFTFWEAYCMKMMGKPIPEWIERALEDYGLLSIILMDSFRNEVETSRLPREMAREGTTLDAVKIVKIDVGSGMVKVGDKRLSLNSKHRVVLCMLSSGGKSPAELIVPLSNFRKWYDKHNTDVNMHPKWVRLFDDRVTTRKRFAGDPQEVKDDIVDIISELRKKDTVFREMFPSKGERSSTPVRKGAILPSNYKGISDELLELLGLLAGMSAETSKK